MNPLDTQPYRADFETGECQHTRTATTAMGALTNTGWTCKDCGKLLSDQPAPELPPPSNSLEGRLRLAEAALTKNGFTKLDDIWVPPTKPAQHKDDLAVDRFAQAMKHKMAVSRDKGRSGWDNEAQCSIPGLAKLLVEHISKGDPVDIANFAMMLHQREAWAVEHPPCNGGAVARALDAAWIEALDGE